jgi:hypothetical protein
VGIVANDTTLSQSFVLKNKRTGLLAMTFRAGLVQPGHRQSATALENVCAMWIVTVDAIHPLLEHWMVLR